MIPKQISEAADLAEQLHKEMFTPQEEVPSEETPEEEVPEEADDSPNYEQLAKDYEQKWKSLQGMYNSSQKELQEFKQAVFERIGKPDEQQQAKPDSKADERLEKFKEQYGDELLDYVNYVAELKAKELIPQTVQPVQDQVQAMEQAQMQVAQQNFTDYLDQKTDRKWRKLWNGEDQKFLSFLEQPDPSGLYTYGDLVNMYNEKWDADKLVKVFDAYWGNQPKPKAANPAKDAMIAPSRQPSQSTPNVQEKRIWTKDMIREFQTADRQKKYTAEESKAMWDDLLMAPSENRIR